MRLVAQRFEPRRKRSVLALLIALLAVLYQPVAALGVGGIGIRPMQPSGSEPGWFLYTLGPGESRADSVLVFNDSDRTHELELAAVDSERSSVGEFALRRNDEPQSGVGNWITLSQRRLTLAAGEKREVKFTITLPKDVDVGEHSGAVTVTSVSVASSSPGGVSTRVGARVYVTVPGEQVHRLQLNSFTAATTEDGLGYDFTLSGANAGNVTLTADAKLHLGGMGMMDWLTPFRSYTLPQQWQLPRGGEVSTYFRSISKPMFGRLVAYVSVQFPGESGIQIVESERVVLTIIPWPQLGLGVGVGLAIIGLIAYGVLGRRRRHAIGDWVDYTVAAGDTIIALAEAGGVTWQILAKHNHLKPPYVLAIGQVLQVPAAVPKAMALPEATVASETTGPVDESAALPVASHPTGHRWLWGALFLGSGVVVAAALLFFVRSASVFPQVNSDFSVPTSTPDALEPLPPTTEATTSPSEPVPTPEQLPAAATSTSANTAGGVDHSTRVLILNGSGVTGEAGRRAAQLRTAGFTQVETGNADQFTYRGLTIRYHPGKRTVAEAVSQVFKAGTLEASSDAVAPVVVIIGGSGAETSDQEATTTPETN